MFCKQDVSAAFTKLKELIADHTALTALTVVPSTLDANVSLLASPPSQAEQELAACKEDIVSLIQAMYRGGHSEKQTVPGFESFGDIAVAFKLHSVYEGLLKNRLQVHKLALVAPVVSWCRHGLPCILISICHGLPRLLLSYLALSNAVMPCLLMVCWDQSTITAHASCLVQEINAARLRRSLLTDHPTG